MQRTNGPYLVNAIDLLGAPMSFTRPNPGDAIHKAVELMSHRLKDVHIVDGDGKRYEPVEFNRLFSRKRNAHADRT